MANPRQKKVIKAIMENNGSVSAAMREAGYSPNYSKNPQTLLSRKSFKELMDEVGMTDDYLLEKHKELMEKKVKGQIDTVARKAALDMAYRLKSSYAPTQGEVKLEMKPILGYGVLHGILQDNSDGQDPESQEEN